MVGATATYVACGARHEQALHHPLAHAHHDIPDERGLEVPADDDKEAPHHHIGTGDEGHAAYGLDAFRRDGRRDRVEQGTQQQRDAHAQNAMRCLDKHEQGDARRTDRTPDVWETAHRISYPTN